MRTRPCLEVLEGRDLPAPIVTPWDTIPNYADTPNIAAVGSGNWSNPAIWSLGRVPAAGDRVVCGSPHTVTYDVISDAALDSLALTSGCLLTVSRATPTRLTVGTFQVQAGAWADWGNGTSPVTSTAEIVFTDTDPADPDKFGTGLIVLGSFSSLGVSRQSWSALAVAPRANDTTLSLTAAPAGWAPGDRLILADGRSGQSADWHGETPTIASVSGTTVTLTAPLTYDHLGVATFLPYVGNLTRNVVVRSANPNGVHGHVMATDRANFFSFYTEYRDLGRTTTAVGSLAGRYPIHMHHLMGAYPTISTHQFMLAGLSIHSTVTGPRWAITVHDSHYGLVQGNTVYNSTGWGIGTETGGETSNEILWNFVVRTTGQQHSGISPGNDGSSFWLTGPKNFIAGNVAADARNTQFEPGVNSFSGFNFHFVLAGLVLVGNERIPDYRGASTGDGGAWHLENMNLTPLALVQDNIAYGTGVGLEYWFANFNGIDPELPSGGTVRNFTSWNNLSGIITYYSSHITVDGLTLYGSGSGTGFLNYTGWSNTVLNFDIRGFILGVYGGATQGVNETYAHGILQNTLNFQVVTRENTLGEWVRTPPQERTTIIDDVQFIGPVLQMRYQPNGLLHNYAARDDVYLYNFQRMPGNHYRAYYREQRSDFVVPQTTYTMPGGPGSRIGSPVAGLTNQQNWDTWEWRIHPTTLAYESRAVTGDPGWRRVAIGGSLAPASAVDGAFIGVNGLIEDLTP